MSQTVTPPKVDEARIKDIFGKLEVMDIPLDTDPLQYGPKRLNSKVAKARRMASECEAIYMTVSKDLQLLKRLHRQAELDFNLQMQDLFTNDPEVRSNRNVRDREAAATMKLRDEREQVDSLGLAFEDLVMVMSVIKAKRADLKDIQGRIRDQIKLCQEELNLGAHWGSRPAPDGPTPNIDKSPRTARSVLDQFNDLIIEEGEVNVAVGDESLMDEDDLSDDSLPGEVEDADESDDEVDALLRAVDNVVAHASDPEDEDPVADLDTIISDIAAETEIDPAPTDAPTVATSSHVPDIEDEIDDDVAGPTFTSTDDEDEDDVAGPTFTSTDDEDADVVVNLFDGESEPAKDESAGMGTLNSNDDVESFFDNLASATPAPVASEDVDLDDLLGMLG